MHSDVAGQRALECAEHGRKGRPAVWPTRRRRARRRRTGGGLWRCLGPERQLSPTLRTAGTGNAVYPTTQAALNGVTDAVFYIESEVKDMKLAGPLGVDMMACSSEICPALLESRFGGRSKANIVANLEGLRRLLEGCGPRPFRSWLRRPVDGAGARRLGGHVANARGGGPSRAGGISRTRPRRGAGGDKPSVQALYDAVKAVTDLLKTDFATLSGHRTARRHRDGQ